MILYRETKMFQDVKHESFYRLCMDRLEKRSLFLFLSKSKPKPALLRTKNAEMDSFKGHSKGHTVTQRTSFIDAEWDPL